jgi:sugar lactone lactonase YvrE
MRKTSYTFMFLLFCAQLTAQNASWRNLYLPNTPITTNTWDLAFDKDTNFYVSTDTLLFRYNLGVWTKLTPPLNQNEKLRHLAIDNQGGVWVSVVDKGVLRWHNNTWKKYDISNSILPEDVFNYMKYDSISKLMIFGTAYGVVTFNSTTNTWINIGIPTDYGPNAFLSDDLAINKAGEWYFSDLGSRVDIYKPQTRVWRKIGSPFTGATFNIGVDLNNNLYVADRAPSILRYDTIAKSWKNLPFTKGQDLSSSGFTVDKKNMMWHFSQNNGLIRFDSLNNRKITMSNSPLYSNSVAKVVVGPNNLKYILGKGGGVQILNDSLLFTGIKETTRQTTKMISSYNNPIQQNLVIHLDKSVSTPQLTMQIHDLEGRLLHQNTYDVKQNQIELNTASLPSGIYFVTCWDVPNQRKEVLTVVKQ